MATRTLTYILLGKDELSPAAKKAGRSVDEMHSRIRTSLSGIAGLAVSAGGAAGLAFGGVAGIKAGIQYNANLEQAKIGFTTMLGSAKEAGAFLNKLQAFAAKTPFNFPDLVTASQRMIAFGFKAKDVIPNLTAIGDAAAGLGVGAEGVDRITTAIGQMQAKTRVQSDELLQLTEAGVPALRILANQFHVSTGKMQEMITKGLVPSSKAIPLLLQGIEKGTTGAAGATTKFGGLMAAQSHTLTGVFSNFVDVANRKLGELVAPALPFIKKSLSFLTDSISGKNSVGDHIKSMVDTAKPVLLELGRTIGSFGHSFVVLFDAVKPVAMFIGGAFVNGLKLILGFFKNMPGPMKIAGLAFIALGVAMRLAAAANPWLLLAAAVITVIGVIHQHWAGFETFFKGVMKHLSDAWHAVTEFLKNTGRAAINVIIGIFRGWVNFTLGIFAAILHGAVAMFGWVPGVGGKLKQASKAFDTFRNNVNNSLGGIQGKTVTVGVRMTSSNNPYAGGISGRAATGGRITGPGGPTSDRAGLFALSNGEWVVKASSAGKYGYAAMDAVNQGRAVIHYANGGGVNVMPQTPSGSAIHNSVWNSLIRLVKSSPLAQVLAGSSGSAGWTSVILQALALLHQSASWLPVVMHRLMQESGGNASIVNKWDSNWLAGTPSVGGMQVIGPTFAAYAGPFRNIGPFLYGVSINKLANMYAGLNYALHRYGSLSALMRPGGYAFGGPVLFDNGGYLPPHSATLALNGTGSYEPVGGRNGNTYNITINPTPLARPADIGREVVSAIKDFERGAGKGWRS